MNKLITYINKLNSFKFIISASLLSYISTILFTLISLYLNNITKLDVNTVLDVNTELPLAINLFIAIFLVPIIESGIILVIINLINKFIKNKVHLLLISAILFSCLHYYSLIYILAVFIPSLIFIYSYLIYKSKNVYLKAIAMMTIIHSLYNFYNILFRNIF